MAHAKVPGNLGWRISLGGGVSILLIIYSFSLSSETPNSLVEKGRYEEAKALLKRIHGVKANVEVEFNNIVAAMKESRLVQNPWKNLVNKKCYRPQLAMSILIPLFQQFTGISVIIFYGPLLFQTIGFERNASHISAIVIGIAYLLAIVVLICGSDHRWGSDRWGRRSLFLESGIQMFIFQMAVAVVLIGWRFSDSTTIPSWSTEALVTCIFMYVVAFPWSWGPLGWFYPSEIFPLEVRSAAQNVTIAVNMLAAFIIGQFFLTMFCTMQSGVFIFFAFVVVMMTMYCYIFMPEAKNMPVEEMTKVWRDHWFWRRYMNDTNDHVDEDIVKTQLNKQRALAANQTTDKMRDSNNAAYEALEDGISPKLENFKKVSIIPLVFLIFYEVSGGPFGVEDSVQAAGPLLALLGFLLFPLIWSVPEALITAELGTMFPENGGYVVWVSSALNPFWGFQQGWVKWLSGVIDNALYPVLFLDYLKSAVPILADGFFRMIAVLSLTFALTYMNYRGLTIVGWVAILLGVFSLLPFLFMGLIAIPKLEPSRWFVLDLNNVDWALYLNTLFWNLNYWDSISTLAGEVENPGRTLPKALFYALILVVIGYFFPLLIGTGGVPLNRDLWNDGYFSDIAKILGGVWLRFWVQGASALSNMGMFVAEMSSDSFQLLGMAERGMLPECFAKRSRYGTPSIGILFSASGVILLSWLSFQEIVAAENFLYCFGMIMEFIAFVKVRIKYPAASRPYKIPIGTTGAVLMCIPPTLLILVVLVLASFKVMVLSFLAVLIGFVLEPSLKYSEKKGWLRFSVSPELQDFNSTARGIVDE
ncbi:hypothetical protein BUALT_Bualt15G0005900 [Buddleja alternifolia]|uniref:Major facilitator superfamily (MFS) profile domain-containing protein n=1 Tax=Buddleja alternifolia TaxID=168488 RepID=A0AAV6WCZ4_9LAMI|nr:hypothetical protein BUALT_Bualt15G0005900 [Buddleja alternifolia]